MLQILLLILKIIGIILAVILGIVLLLIGILLFVPIRYEISAKCDGSVDTLKAKVKATWFLHLLRADVLVKGKKLKWQIRAAWVRKKSAMVFGEEKDRKKNEKKEEPVETTVNNENTHETPKVMEEKQGEHKKSVEGNQLDNIQNECRKDSEKESKNVEDTLGDSCERNKTDASEDKKERFCDKIQKIVKKIKAKIQSVYEKINDLLEKKEKITDFLTNEIHVRAFHKVKKALFVLLKHLVPKKIQIKLRFGFEDPSVTGKVLAGFGVLYPFLGETAEIVPDFENQILKGSIYLKGRIRFCHFAAMAVKLILSKDIRISYKDIRNFKL